MLTRPAKARQAVSGDGDRFELSSKGGRRWERQEQCQLFDVAEFCTGITVMFVDSVCVLFTSGPAQQALCCLTLSSMGNSGAIS